MAQKLSFILIAVLSVIIGFYPAIYLFAGNNFGLLASKPPELLMDILWRSAFYTHIGLGGVALLVGWLQFNTKFRERNIATHRTIGKVYVVSVLLSALAGIFIAFNATGGWIPSLGFIGLGIVWFTTTLLAFLTIRNGQAERHRRLMIYSYAACFAAVTLRIWLPMLAAISGDFVKAYTIVAWLCWVPNIIVAYLIVKRTKHRVWQT
jgi:uncharacterized membrane protein